MRPDREQALWVLKAQSGDKEAFDQLLRTVQRPLHSYILSLVGRGELADDVLQDVMLLIYRKLYWLREPQLFRPWAYRIASREAFRCLKREERWRHEELEDATATMPKSLETKEAARLTRLLLSEISEGSRAVLVLHYLHDLTLAEVAEVLGIRPGTVKSRLAYGLATLRRKTGTRGAGAAGSSSEGETR